MISGMAVSYALIEKMSNLWMLHWKRGNALKSSSIDVGLMEKFVKQGALHRKGRCPKVTSNNTPYKLSSRFVLSKHSGERTPVTG